MFIFGMFVCGVLNYFIAVGQRRSGVLGFFAGLWFGVFGIVFYMFLGERKD